MAEATFVASASTSTLPVVPWLPVDVCAASVWRAFSALATVRPPEASDTWTLTVSASTPPCA